MNWSDTISTATLVLLAIMAVAFLLYALVRLAGSAWYKSKMEYHQKILRGIKGAEKYQTKESKKEGGVRQ